jgi:hypothetical protein
LTSRGWPAVHSLLAAPINFAVATEQVVELAYESRQQHSTRVTKA